MATGAEEFILAKIREFMKEDIQRHSAMSDGRQAEREEALHGLLRGKPKFTSVIVQSIKSTLCCLPEWNIKLNAHK